MLNCTDLECILHHHHYYAQLHHLTHGTHVEENSMSTEADGTISEESIQSLLNDTDAPNESLYMIGGVLIAMVLVGVIIVLLAVTISKLRKREEHSNSVHPANVVLQTQPTTQHPAATQTGQQQTQPPQFLWQYPPQQSLYSNDQNPFVQNHLPTARPGFVHGIRKNLGGQWRRFVKRKPQTEVYSIPAELKPQLKQIYVY